MSGADFIAGDWGTSRLRLCLCDGAGAVRARRDGPGIAEAGSDAASVFARLAADWDAALPALLSGMVGSTIGWREVPYLHCPIALTDVTKGVLQFESGGRRIVLAPGLSCRNASGLFDVMRGEETQLLGAMRLAPELARGRHLVCLPGTHAKWVLVEDGRVVRFQTALSGELFALLSQHSVLARGAAEASDAAFDQGAATAKTNRQAGLLHLLFSTRSRQLAGEIGKDEATSYLSGLIIGEDVTAGLRLFGPADAVTLVGEPALTSRYARALGAHGVDARAMVGDDAALAGLGFLHTALFGA